MSEKRKINWAEIINSRRMNPTYKVYLYVYLHKHSYGVPAAPGFDTVEDAKEYLEDNYIYEHLEIS